MRPPISFSSALLDERPARTRSLGAFHDQPIPSTSPSAADLRPFAEFKETPTRRSHQDIRPATSPPIQEAQVPNGRSTLPSVPIPSSQRFRSTCPPIYATYRFQRYESCGGRHILPVVSASYALLSSFRSTRSSATSILQMTVLLLLSMTVFLPIHSVVLMQESAIPFAKSQLVPDNDNEPAAASLFLLSVNPTILRGNPLRGQGWVLELRRYAHTPLGVLVPTTSSTVIHAACIASW